LNDESLSAFSAVVKSSNDRTAIAALDHATNWYIGTSDRSLLEAGARRFALTLGRTMELALLTKQAQWSNDAQTIANARRFAASGIDLILADHPEERTNL